jgi:hypothetical protein
MAAPFGQTLPEDQAVIAQPARIIEERILFHSNQIRHGRPRGGHLYAPSSKEIMGGRDKPGHDGFGIEE